MNLDKLSLDELKKLESDVKKAIANFQVRRRQEALNAVEAKAREMGFSLKELAGAAPKSKSGGVPKYAHPENPSITWSGRGRQPAWIKEALAKGKKLESFLIGK